MDLFSISEDIAIETPKKNDSIKISKIKIENYRSIKYLVIDTQDKSVVLEGDNGVGKTSVIEAVFMLLSGRLFDGRAKLVDQAIKPIGSPNDTKTHIHIEFNSGFTFSGTFFETYDTDGLLTKTNSVYEVNGAIEKTVSGAYALLHNHLGIKKISDDFAIATDPVLKNIDFIRLFYDLWYVKTLDYKYLRALVINMVGDISYEEIINSSPQYAPILDEFKKSNKDLEALKERLRTEKFGNKISKNGLEQVKTVLEAQIRDYEIKAETVIDNEELKIAQSNLDAINEKINELKLSLTKNTQDLTQGLSGELSKKELEREKEVSRIKDEWQRNHDKIIDENKLANTQVDTLRTEIIKLQAYKNAVESNRLKEQSKLESLSSNLQSKRIAFESTRETYQTENREVTAPISQEIFKLYEAKEFATRKEELENLLKALKEDYTNLKQDIALQEQVVAKKIVVINETDSKIEILEKQHNEATKSVEIKGIPTLVLESELLNTLDTEIKDLKTRIYNLKNGGENTEIITINSKIKELETSKEPINEILSKKVEKDLNSKYVVEAREKLNTVVKRLNTVETLLEMIKMIERDKYVKLDTDISNKFGKNIKFKMYDYNQDGSIDTRVCDMLVKDGNGTFVNIKNINTGNYPIAMLDFITHVKQHYNVPNSFIFIDEFGQVVGKNIDTILGFDEQIIATKPSLANKIEVKLI